MPIHSTPSLILTQNSTLVNPDLIGACIYLLLCFQMGDFLSACFAECWHIHMLSRSEQKMQYINSQRKVGGRLAGIVL